MLSALNVNLGDELITFQDASIHTYIQLPEGISKSLECGEIAPTFFDGTSKDTIRNLQDLLPDQYTNTVGIGGLVWQQLLGNDHCSGWGWLYSAIDAFRDASQVKGDILPINFAHDILEAIQA